MPDPGEALEDRRTKLKVQVLQGIHARDPSWWDRRFEGLAVEIFRYQCEANPVYGRFVRGRSVDPSSVRAAEEIPAVPARGFKDVALVCGNPDEVERVFLTSGTTRSGASGKHYVRDLSLYRASLLGAVGPLLALQEARHTRTSIRILSLVPETTARPDSSLAFMVGEWAKAWGDGNGGSFSDHEWHVDTEGFERALVRAVADDAPSLIVGTAFSFVHWLDGSDGRVPSLPAGSVVVETGGFKGRSRRLDRSELYDTLSERLGIPIGRIVNEYGMTEMLSQFYEPVLTGRAPSDPSKRWHVGPPWVRTSILDPRTLDPVPRGAPGLLCHLDLANLDSVCCVLTEDTGVETADGFRLLGRLEGAEPRGCSLAADVLRTAAGEPTE